MTDLRSVLARAAEPVPVDAHTVDADLARGRRALRHRRTAGGAGALVLVTVAAGVAATAGSPDTPQRVTVAPTTAPPTVAPTTPVPTRTATVRAIRLVTFTGSQPSGYKVAYVPSGWEIQAAYPAAMVIAPVGFPDQEQYSFEGKLVVMLRSASDTGQPTGEPIPVGKGTGYLRHEGDLSILTYQDAQKHWVQLQVPASLGWSNTELGTFASGVVVTGNAVAGVG